MSNTINTLATWCKELTHWKRPWCWERLRAGGEGDDRGWDGWMASPTQWTWVWVNSGSSWWTGRPGVLQFMGLQRVRHDWSTELNWSTPAAITNRIRFQKPDTISNVQVPFFQGMAQGSRLFLSSDSTVFQPTGWEQRVGSWKIVQHSFSRFL